MYSADSTILHIPILLFISVVLVAVVSSNRAHNAYCDNWSAHIKERQQQLDMERQQLEQNIFRSDAEVSAFNSQNLLSNQEVSKYNQECAY